MKVLCFRYYTDARNWFIEPYKMDKKRAISVVIHWNRIGCSDKTKIHILVWNTYIFPFFHMSMTQEIYGNSRCFGDKSRYMCFYRETTFSQEFSAFTSFPKSECLIRRNVMWKFKINKKFWFRHLIKFFCQQVFQVVKRHCGHLDYFYGRINRVKLVNTRQLSLIINRHIFLKELMQWNLVSV